jgi:hypothetical protein
MRRQPGYSAGDGGNHHRFFARCWGTYIFGVIVSLPVLSTPVVIAVVGGRATLHHRAGWSWSALIPVELFLVLSSLYLGNELLAPLGFCFSDEGVRRRSYLPFVTCFLAWKSIDAYAFRGMNLCLFAGNKMIGIPLYTFADQKAVLAFIQERVASAATLRCGRD